MEGISLWHFKSRGGGCHLCFHVFTVANIHALVQPLHARLMAQQRTAQYVTRPILGLKLCSCTHLSSCNVTCVSRARACAAALRSIANSLHETRKVTHTNAHAHKHTHLLSCLRSAVRCERRLTSCGLGTAS